MIEIPTNAVQANDYDKAVAEVLIQLNSDYYKNEHTQKGTAYLDWGQTSALYKNCPSKSIADQVAHSFKEKGYYVYIQRMGCGHRRIPEGTPVCYRIQTKARAFNNWDEL